MYNSNISEPIDYNKVQEPNRNRFEIREIEVYNDFYNMDKEKFVGIEEYVKVTRTTHFKNSDKVSKETSYYISSKQMPAKEYNKGIQVHWSACVQ